MCGVEHTRGASGVNLVEAQYCGLPVVAASNRGHRAIIRDGENGFLVPLNDAEAMAERVEALMDSPSCTNACRTSMSVRILAILSQQKSTSIL